MENASKALANLKEKVAGNKGISKERQDQINEIMAKEAAETTQAKTAIEDLKATSEQARTAVESGNPQTIANEAGKLGNAEQVVQTGEKNNEVQKSSEDAKKEAMSEEEFNQLLESASKELDKIPIDQLDATAKAIREADNRDAKKGPNRDGTFSKGEADVIRESLSKRFAPKIEKILQNTAKIIEDAKTSLANKDKKGQILEIPGVKNLLDEKIDSSGNIIHKGNTISPRGFSMSPDLIKEKISEVRKSIEIAKEIKYYCENVRTTTEGKQYDQRDITYYTGAIEQILRPQK